jgi:uncharacterized protein YciI
MKYCFLLFSMLLFSGIIFSQKENKKYDAKLAQKLGADEYGMKMYVMVILKTGERTEYSESFSDSCFRGHMDNINRLVKAHKMIVAGPFEKNDKTFRGIFILDVKTVDEARDLLKADPAVSEKILEAEYFHWYGSAALPTYLENVDKISKKSH